MPAAPKKKPLQRAKADENTAGSRKRAPTKKAADTRAAEAQKKAAPAAGTKDAQSIEIARLKEKVYILQDSLATANEERDTARKEAQTAKKILKKKEKVVKLKAPPKGSFGFKTYVNKKGKTIFGYNLQTEMDLAGDIGSDKNNKYNQIVNTVHYIAARAGIDLTRSYMHQDPSILADFFNAMKESHPYLARFERNWATADLLKQYLANKVRTGRAKGLIPKKGEGEDERDEATVFPGRKRKRTRGPSGAPKAKRMNKGKGRAREPEESDEEEQDKDDDEDEQEGRPKGQEKGNSENSDSSGDDN